MRFIQQEKDRLEANQAARRPQQGRGKSGKGQSVALERHVLPRLAELSVLMGGKEHLICAHVRLLVSKDSLYTDTCRWADIRRAGLEWICISNRAEELDMSKVVGVLSV